MAERFLNFQIQEIQELKENSENKNNEKEYIDLAKCLDKLGRKQDFTTSLLAYKRKQIILHKFLRFLIQTNNSVYSPNGSLNFT